MAADVARKTRLGTFGIALCFLAALFFIEAKTTWVVFSGQIAAGISSSKTQTVDLGQKAEADTKLGTISDQTAVAIYDIAAALVLFALVVSSQKVQTIIEHLPMLVFDCSNHERSVRPPPHL